MTQNQNKKSNLQFNKTIFSWLSILVTTFRVLEVAWHHSIILWLGCDMVNKCNTWKNMFDCNFLRFQLGYIVHVATVSSLNELKLNTLLLCICAKWNYVCMHLFDIGGYKIIVYRGRCTDVMKGDQISKMYCKSYVFLFVLYYFCNFSK